MKITGWQLYTPDTRFHVFVEIHTDSGLSGWGSAYSERGQVLGALAWLQRFVIGENPLEIERVTEKLHQITFWIGRGGAMTHAISAINLALWDIAGKAYGQPVHVLSGGALRTSVPAYGSILFRPVDTLEERIQAMLALGFKAIKLGWDPFFRGALADDERLVRRARQTAGDDIMLAIDAGGSSPYWRRKAKDALERAKMLADFGVYWFEEPLAPDDVEGYALLVGQSPVKIAHGEVLTGWRSFLPHFQARTLDIVQPDATKAGGLSEMRRIAALADAHGIELIPHGWNTAIGVAADIHLVSTLPEGSLVEFNVGNPLVEEILEEPFRLDEQGRLPIPHGPGLGIQIDRERLRRLDESGFASGTWAWDESREYERRMKEMNIYTLASPTVRGEPVEP